MEKIKVIVISATTAVKDPGTMDLKSGVIEYDNGTISHVVSERSAGKTIEKVIEEVKPKEVKIIIEEPSPERSPVKKKLKK